MKLRYDELADALYVELAANTVMRSQRVTFNVSLDFDADGEVIGMEVLNVRKRGLNPDEIGVKMESPVSQARPDTETIETERARRRAARQGDKVAG